MSGRMSGKDLTRLAMLTAAASVLHIIENALPPLISSLAGIPGARLGLANIPAVICILNGQFLQAILLTIVRCAIGLIASGSVTGFLYSLAGALLSCGAMQFIYKLLKENTNAYLISVAGAMMHNVGQISMAAIFMKSLYVFNLLPYLLLLALPTGLFIALCALQTRKIIKKYGG